MQAYDLQRLGSFLVIGVDFGTPYLWNLPYSSARVLHFLEIFSFHNIRPSIVLLP